MAITLTNCLEQKERASIRCVRDGTLVTRVWKVGIGASESELGLVKGLTLPDDSTVCVQTWQFSPSKDGLARFLSITAFKPDLYPAATGTLLELRRSRIQDDESDTIRLTRRFYCLASAMTESTDGWTVSGLPAIGASYPAGTWSASGTPVAVRRHREPNPPGLDGFSIVSVVYEAERYMV